jgi:serine protease Do
MVMVLVLAVGAALPAFAETPVTGTALSAAAQGGAIVTLAAKAKPSIVGILTTMKAVRSTQKSHAAGTGWVYKEGVIITNAHVVEDAVEVKILYADKTIETVAPSQIFEDKTADIAVIRVTTKNLVPLVTADSDKVMVGMPVVAIGNPMGFRLGNSVTSGILSGVGRPLGAAYSFLQTDAPINPGNSGGPLFNLDGQVIGINSNKLADIGVEGLNFAIPVNTAKQIAEVLLQNGKVERATLGMTLDEDWQAQFGVPNAEGVTIASTISDGPVGKTALQPGDKLVKIDDTMIFTSDDYYGFLAAHKPGDTVAITVKRSGQVLSSKVTLVSEDGLRKAAEEQGVQDQGGILIGLTAGQIQEAAEFGRQMSRGSANINRDYFASSGPDFAFLFTEYLYVARRISSAYEFGFQPGVGFQQSLAKEINKKVEVQVQIQGDVPDFLNNAAYYLEQNGKRVAGDVSGTVNYTQSPDGKVIIAMLAIRFPTGTINSTDDLTLTIQRFDGKASVFHFAIKDLR